MLTLQTSAVTPEPELAERGTLDTTLRLVPSMALPTDTGIGVLVTNRIEDVEAIWRELSAGAVESPGQSYDFIRLWVANRHIAETDQRYVVGRVDGVPVALLPLHRRTLRGLSLFTWFPGSNVGCYAPVAYYDRLAKLDHETRCALWQAMTGALTGADVVYLRSIPTEVGGHPGLFDELGAQLEVETLYRSQYASWAECDKLQRSKSRRKHDRQQGDRLNALGNVTFEELRNGDETRCVIETMFAQRSARFKAMGIRDPFVRGRLTPFYHEAIRPSSGIDVRLHVLRLDGVVVAVRYNIVMGDRMFCLISSMSDDPAIQGGSPGKQCLLRVMQTVFDQGIRVFDMGHGFTDEKRHWCNVQIPLRQHYIGLNLKGRAIVKAHRVFQRTRVKVKNNKQLKTALRAVQTGWDRLTGGHAAPPPAASSD
jgi:CelD/BcsL family acetyltransferase involved in cellulose biosynthesis